MAHVHFFEVRNKAGELVLVRADSVNLVEPAEGGLMLHTTAGPTFAAGATRATFEDDMKGVGMIVVKLNRNTGTFVSQPVPPAQTATEPPRQVVVRAPPPVEVPGVNAPEDSATVAQSTESAAAPAKRTVKKAAPAS